MRKTYIVEYLLTTLQEEAEQGDTRHSGTGACSHTPRDCGLEADAVACALLRAAVGGLCIEGADRSNAVFEHISHLKNIFVALNNVARARGKMILKAATSAHVLRVKRFLLG